LKICVLAMDGLEARWVKRWKLKNLLQEYHGEIPLTEFKERYGRIHSLEIWTTFLTGKMPEKALSWYEVRFSKPFVKKILKKMRLYNVVKDVLMKFKPSLFLKYENVKKHSSRTLPDIIKPSLTIDMILYDNYEGNFRRLAKAINRGFKEYEEEVYRQFRNSEEKLLRTINLQERYKLILAYFRLADSIGHVFVKRKRKLFKAYLALDRLAYLVRKKYDGAILIISDHGMTEEGEHSMESFWSLNVKPPLIPKSIVDLNSLVLELAK